MKFPLAVHEIPWASPDGQALVARQSALFPRALLLDGRFVGFGRLSELRLRRLLEQRAVTLPCKGA